MSFDVLNPKTVIQGHFSLEASAGTGKTFSIEHIVCRLLLENVPLKEILIVTFTKAATRDLKKRIQNNLEKALLSLQNQTHDFPYLVKYDRSKSIQLLQNALREFMQAEIYTIHSFCYRKLLEFAFDCNFHLQIKNPEESTNNKAAYDFIKDFLHGLSPNSYHFFELRILYRHYKTFKKLSDRILSSFKNAKQDPLGFYDLFQQFQKAAQELPPIKEENLVQDFQALSPYFKKLKKLVEIDSLVSFLADTSLPSFLNLLKSELSVAVFLHPDNLKINRKGYDKLNLSYPGFFQHLHDKLLPLVKEILNPKRIFKKISFDINPSLHAFLEQENQSCSDELLRKMELALQNDLFCKQVKKQYQAFLIDECQDTDPVQWKIFDRLFREKPHIKTFYMVGDPKQSIYGFRNADLYQYYNACQSVENQLLLTTNYRSTPSLINALNELFSKKADWFALPLWNRKEKYKKVFAGREKKLSIGDEKKALHFFVTPSQKTSKKFPSSDLEKNYLFPFIAKEILALTKKFSFSDFAILVKDRYQARSLKAFLSQKKIPSITKSKSLSEIPLLQDFKSLISTMYDLEDESKIKRTLASSFFSFTYQDLSSLNTIPNTLLSLLYELQACFIYEGLPSFFEKLLKTRLSSQKTVLENLISQDLYQEARDIIEALLKRSDPLEFFEQIPFQQEERSIASDDQEVSIITMHMSKGLEFPIVFALGVINRAPLNEEKDSQEINAEALRGLYVALTRAKERLYVPVALSEKKPKLGTESAMELFLEHFIEEPCTKDTFLKNIQPLIDKNLISVSFLDTPLTVDPYNPHIPSLYKPPSLLRSLKKVEITSFSALQKSHKETETIKPNEKEIPKGKQTGVCLHRILERALSETSTNLSSLVSSELQGSSLEPFKLPIYQLIEKTLQTPLLKDPSSALIHIPKEKIQTEVEFLYEQDSHTYLKGFIDVVFEYKNKYYIIDWKTHFLESYQEPHLKTTIIQEGYDKQALIYTEALKRYLAAFSTNSSPTNFGGALIIFLRGLPSGQGIYTS